MAGLLHSAAMAAGYSTTGTQMPGGAAHGRAVVVDASGAAYLIATTTGAPSQFAIAKFAPTLGGTNWYLNTSLVPGLACRAYGAAFASTSFGIRLFVVGWSFTAVGMATTEGVVAQFDPSNGNLVRWDPMSGCGNGGNEALYAVTADPSDNSVVWAAGVRGTCAPSGAHVEKFGENGSLGAYYADASGDEADAILVTGSDVYVGGGSVSYSYLAHYSRTAFPAAPTYVKTEPPPAGRSLARYRALVANSTGGLVGALTYGSGAEADLGIALVNPGIGLIQQSSVLISGAPALTVPGAGLAYDPMQQRYLVGSYGALFQVDTNLQTLWSTGLPASTVGQQYRGIAFRPSDRTMFVAGYAVPGGPDTPLLLFESPASDGPPVQPLNPGSIRIRPNVLELGVADHVIMIEAQTSMSGADVAIRLYDAAGRYVGQLAGKTDGAGVLSVPFHGLGRELHDGRDLGPGLYWAVASGGSIKDKRPFVVVLRASPSK